MSSIWIGNDHGGYELKLHILEHLKNKRIGQATGIEAVGPISATDPTGPVAPTAAIAPAPDIDPTAPIEIVDVGCHSTDIVRYPYYAAQVAAAVSRGEAHRGILICSTGIGMSIIANKFKGVRASLCTSTHMGRMTRAHNDSNILCLGGKTTGVLEALDILDVWLATGYEGGRHDISLGLIAAAERQMIAGESWAPEIPAAQ